MSIKCFMGPGAANHGFAVPALVWAILAVIFFSPHFVSAQTGSKQKKEQLQQQMKKLQDEIKLMEAAAAKANAKKEKSIGELLALQEKIHTRERLIANMSNQIDDLDETIIQTSREIDSSARQVEGMKAGYAAMLRKTYENLAFQNPLAFFLSSSSFTDAVRRYHYLLRADEYRRAQAERLQHAIVELEDKKKGLEVNKDNKVNLLHLQTAQKSKLETEKKEKDQNVATLQQKEQTLRKHIAEKNKAAQQLNSKIQAIIQEEIRQAKKKAEEEAKRNQAKATTTTKTSPANAFMSPAEYALSKDFAANKGKLPWPVERGEIIGQFGQHEHPLLKGVMVENNGVDIKAAPGAEARAIFSGKVVSVFFMPTTQNCVIVKHGEYFTVYSNIETVSVKTGDMLATKQSLGKLHADKTEGLTKVHLEIWKGKDKTDPELWLAGN